VLDKEQCISLLYNISSSTYNCLIVTPGLFYQQDSSSAQDPSRDLHEDASHPLDRSPSFFVVVVAVNHCLY